VSDCNVGHRVQQCDQFFPIAFCSSFLPRQHNIHERNKRERERSVNEKRHPPGVSQTGAITTKTSRKCSNGYSINCIEHQWKWQCKRAVLIPVEGKTEASMATARHWKLAAAAKPHRHCDITAKSLRK